MFADLIPRIEKLRANGHTPGLATVLVGGDDASARYVGMKMRKAQELGCNSPHVHLPEDATTADVIAAVRRSTRTTASTQCSCSIPRRPRSTSTPS